MIMYPKKNYYYYYYSLSMHSRAYSAALLFFGGKYLFIHLFFKQIKKIKFRDKP